MSNYPIGTRVRVTDVTEGVVVARVDEVAVLDNDQWVSPPGDMAPIWTRTIEVLELPRPDEPTQRNAVVLARRADWDREDSVRFPFCRESNGFWMMTNSSVQLSWAELTDITVLYPGGVE